MCPCQVWSPNDLAAHYLFPPGLRKGIKCVLFRLRVALNKARPHMRLSNELWLMVISKLPRGWAFTTPAASKKAARKPRSAPGGEVLPAHVVDARIDRC